MNDYIWGTQTNPTMHFTVPNSSVSSSISSIIANEEVKMKKNKIVQAYLDEMKSAFEKYKNTLINEVNLLHFNDIDGSLYSVSPDKNEPNSRYWFEEYTRLYKELYSLNLISRISINNDGTNDADKTAGQEP